MASPNTLVNLDAMIIRADFAQIAENENSYESITGISVQDFSNGMTGRLIRKPDFQRETNHWKPEQVVSLLECFANGDLIPSVILWKSSTYLFVIDGGHRLSVLKAWVEDDYGDGPTSKKYFGDSISANQKKAAEKTRKLVTEKIGSFQHFKLKLENNQLEPIITSMLTRVLPVQWVKGDVDKAEASFFKINTQGTPLDQIEQALLEYRKRPFAIAARAIIRAGKGHKYWYMFAPEAIERIESVAKTLHLKLFEPEVSTPIKTLDLPLGGAKGIRAALQIIIDYLGIACITLTQKNNKIDFGSDDTTGEQTLEVLKKAERLTSRITGNEKGSLGLHPAIYYYGPSGIHSSPLFLGTAQFISEKLANNDNQFFKSFTMKRSVIEEVLISHKELIATILQKLGSNKRVNSYAALINQIYKAAKDEKPITDEDLVDWSGLSGKIFVGNEKTTGIGFSDESKSKVFIHTTLKTAPKCPICEGYIDIPKSLSYDHVTRVEDGGLGSVKNLQLTHPYCNQSIKN